MGMKGQDAISCRGGLGVHVTRGERRILEMERHLKCLKDKLNMLETMLPPSVTNLKKHDDKIESDRAKGLCQSGCFKMDKKEKDDGEMCLLQSLAIKERKLRDEIFNMECKEKEYLNALSKAQIKQRDKEEIRKDEKQFDLAHVDDSFLMPRKRESGVKEKISRLEEYSKKLCNCLRGIQNNRKEWSQEAEYLSKELTSLEDDPELEEVLGFCISEEKKEKGDVCPCGGPVKCNSCTICACSDWEKDLEMDEKEKLEVKEQTNNKVEVVKKKSQCRCFQSSSDSNQSSNSVEIDDIYKCSISKMQSEISIATTSIPSTVEDLITGDDEDKRKFCCLCSPEDNCQKFCEICLCEWERKHRANHQLYLDDYESCSLCEICNQERFRGGTDFDTFSEKLQNRHFKESLPCVMNKFTPELENKSKQKNIYGSEQSLSSVNASQISKSLPINELRINLQHLKNRNKTLRKWLYNQNQSTNFNPDVEKIVAEEDGEIKQNPIKNGSNSWKYFQRGKSQNQMIPTKDQLVQSTNNISIGFFVLLLTVFSYLSGLGGIFSLHLLFKSLFQILFFPFRICIKIHRYFKIVYDTLREFILGSSEVFLNIFRNTDLIEIRKINYHSTLIRISAFVGLISFLSVLEVFITFLLSIVNFTFHEKFVDTLLKIIFKSRVKNAFLFFLLPLIDFLIFIKFVILFFLDLLLNVVDFCFPKKLKNLSYRMMNSFIITFWIVYKKKSFLWHTSNLVYVIVGFLINKMCSLNKDDIDLGFLKFFYNQSSLCESLESEIIDDLISTESQKSSIFFSILNVTVKNTFKYAKFIFDSFEIK